MNQKKAIFAGCVVLLAMMNQCPASAEATDHKLSLSQHMNNSHRAVSTCQELHMALENQSVGNITVDGSLVCPMWDKPVQIGREVFVTGQNEGINRSSIDFTGDGCAIEMLERSTLCLTDLVLLQNTVDGGVFLPLCRNLQPDTSVILENMAVGMRSCSSPKGFLSARDFLIYEPHLCEVGEGLLFVERAKVIAPEEVIRFDMSLQQIAFVCGVASVEDVMEHNASFPVFCEEWEGNEHKSLNAMVLYIVGLVVLSFMLLVVLAVLVKTRMDRHIRNRWGDWRTGRGNSSNSFMELVQSLGESITKPAVGIAGMRLSLSRNRNKSRVEGEGDSVSLSTHEHPNWDYITLHDIQIEEPLGKGQFSTVHRGTYKGVTVALKMIEHTGTLLDKVPLEAQLTKSISHPNVVEMLLDETHKRSNHVSGLFTSMNLGQTDVFASGESLSMTGELFSELGTGHSLSLSYREDDHGDDGDYVTWIVMEYCDRGPLSKAIHSKAFCTGGKECQPDMIKILLTAMDIASAMRYLHMTGIIHGDLKAQNCLLKSDSNDTRGFVCKVGDFGFSRKIEINTHIETFTCGTVSHQPPELLRDGILTPAADVYAFGILLWQLVMCTAPYANMTHQRIVVSVVEGRRPCIPQNCPLAYSLLIQECWLQDRTERPSFHQIFNRLTEMLSGWVQSPHTSFPEDSSTPVLDGTPEHPSCGLSWWSSDFDHRHSLSSEGLWTNTSLTGIVVGGHKPTPLQPTGGCMVQGSGSNPLYHSQEVQTPDTIMDSTESPLTGLSHSLIGRGSMESIVMNRDQQATAYSKAIGLSPRT